MSAVECAYCSLPVPGARADAQVAEEPAYCCYGCRLAARITQGGGEQGRNTMALTLLGVAIFLSMNVMVVNWMLYGQEVYQPGASPASATAATTVSIFRYLSLLLTAPVLVILGYPIAAGGWRSLRSGQINTDVLIALGAAAAYVFSYVSVIRDSGGTYFDTVCMVLVLVTIGKYTEAGAKLKATRALRELDALVPATAIRVHDGQHEPVATTELTCGDHVLVKPGTRVPADGVVVDNETHVDERIVSGESMPVHKRPGDTVYAGTLNGEGSVTLRVTAVGEGSLLRGIVSLLTEARQMRGRYQRIADRAASVFVPAVIILAIGVTVAAARSVGVDQAILRGLSVLLIACPCALGLATPLAIWVAMGQATRRGIVVRSATALERLAQVNAVVFDKTGTLTDDTTSVSSFHADGDGDTDVEAVLARAAGVARTTHHPLAEAITHYVEQRGITPVPVTSARTVPGRGATANDAGDDTPMFLGSRTFLDEQILTCSDAVARHFEELTREGSPCVEIGWSGKVRGVFGFSESIRPQARTTLAGLERRGLSVSVLTGDHARRGQRLAQELAVNVEAGLLPADKVDRIRAMSTQGRRVLMAGDGINDAPALAAAHIGVAMGCGADVSRESADICLIGDELDAIPWLIELGKRTVRVIRQNLFWAFAYNVVGLYLAATGRLSPVFAALAMVASSIMVVTNSLRLTKIANQNPRRESGARRGNVQVATPRS